MIEQSRKIEPRARYYCADAIAFFKKDKAHYDYILGMYNFLCGSPHDDRKEFIQNCIKRLVKGGELILNIRWTHVTLREYVRLAITPLFCLYIGRTYHFGDVVYNIFRGRYTFAHYFTQKEITALFYPHLPIIEGTLIRYVKK